MRFQNLALCAAALSTAAAAAMCQQIESPPLMVQDVINASTELARVEIQFNENRTPASVVLPRGEGKERSSYRDAVERLVKALKQVMVDLEKDEYLNIVEVTNGTDYLNITDTFMSRLKETHLAHLRYTKERAMEKMYENGGETKDERNIWKDVQDGRDTACVERYARLEQFSRGQRKSILKYKKALCLLDRVNFCNM